MSKFIVVFFAIFFFTENCHAQIEANEWCPKGTWWAYTAQHGIWFKDRSYYIFVYTGDTLFNNIVTKKCNMYYTGVLMTPQGTGYLDSLLYTPKLDGVIYMQNRNDSIFIRYEYMYTDSSGNNGRTILDFKFYYKIKYNINDKVIYKDTVAVVCQTGEIACISDTHCLKNITIDTFTNKQGELISLKHYNLYFKNKRYMNYDDICHNMLPLKKMIYAYNIDSFYKLFPAHSLEDSFYCYYNTSRAGRTYYPERIECLMCYYQGGKGYLVDDYIKGNFNSGCEYLKLAMDKSSITTYPIWCNFSIYPNPSTEYLIIENHFSKMAFAIIQAMDGKIILKEKLDRNISKIWIDSIPNGKYVLYIVDSNGLIIKTEKIVKN